MLDGVPLHEMVPWCMTVREKEEGRRKKEEGTRVGLFPLPWRLLLVPWYLGPLVPSLRCANPGQSFVVQAEQGDDQGHVFRTTDPPAHPARLRQHMMRAGPAARNQFVAAPRRKRQVGQPVAVEMSDLTMVEGELDAAETVRM